MPFTTYADLIDHASAYLGRDVSKYGSSLVRRAIQLALHELPSHHDWSYYQTWGRVTTVAPYTTGTIEFDYTGGTYELMVTLTGGTWPAWARYGTLRIGTVDYPVSDRKSGTVITLGSGANPGEDVAADTEYVLYRDAYSLPADLQSMGDLVNSIDGTRPLAYTTLNNMVLGSTLVGQSRPTLYTIAAGRDNDGGLAVRFWPPPDTVYKWDFAYRRRPRAMVVEKIDTGTVSCTSGGSTVTGSATGFTSKLVGTVIRLSPDAKPPTAVFGDHPYTFERKVLSVESATSLTVDGAFTETLSRVAYTASDPLDCDPGVMENCFLQLVFKQARSLARMQPTAEERSEFERGTAAARDADCRFFGNRGAGTFNNWPRRLADYPIVNGEAV